MKVSVHNNEGDSSDASSVAFYDAPALPPKRTLSRPAERQSVDTLKSSKRARIRPPAAGLQGVKRVVAAARDVSTRAGQEDADALTKLLYADGSNAEEDESFARMKRPKKKVKQKHGPIAADSAPAAGKAVPLATGKKRKAVAPAVASDKPLRHTQDKPALSSDSEPDLPIQSAPTGGRSKAVRQARDRQRRKATRPRVSLSYNFVPDGTAPVAGAPAQLHLADEEARLNELLDEVDALRSAGNAYYRSGMYKDALACYSDALVKFPYVVAEVPPPLSLLTNRAAANISLGQYEDALQDMRTALGYPCTDIEGNAKRLGRLLRCYVALGMFDDPEVRDAIAHTEHQLGLLSRSKGAERIRCEASKTMQELQAAVDALANVQRAREDGGWQQVLEGLDELAVATSSRMAVGAPQEWRMFRAEALGMLGRVEEAKPLVASYMKQSKPNDPAVLWFNAIFSFARAEVPQAVSALDALRLQTELHTQASRLLHRAYTISSLQAQAATHASASKWNKVVAAYTEILRIASGDQDINAESRLSVLLSRIEAYLHLRNFPAALRDSSEVLDSSKARNPHRFRARVLLAKLHIASDSDTAAAIGSLESALSNVKDVPAPDVQAAQVELRRLRVPHPAQCDQSRWREGASHYEILNVKPSASLAEVRAAYKKESLLCHPDKVGGDAERFKRVNEAYTSLTAAKARGAAGGAGMPMRQPRR